ncbi:FkbM family methyltransferase [Pontibacter aydingkolensis]|uniref:FkbM family methyltransferase n=1 Tax=Pontibacter aydingkolensis TaxID=1911536 RepID=A0ABS7CPF3_9BACT|nr:FkbM family methyltransferase [Pontibacter aydingkolensis]MBW7465704.1 FkbM family methyltransferase [Pontibacter aydingkolensis]
MIRQIIKEIPFIGRGITFIYRAYYWNFYIPLFDNPFKPYDSPTLWLKQYFNLKNNLSIIQIGSNDGKTGDPLFSLINEYKDCTAIFVEPIPYLYLKLKQNYNFGSRFVFENIAINDGTKQTFYSVSEYAKDAIPNLPSWYDQLGSFNKTNILNHLDGILEPYIKETIIEGSSLKQLLKKNQINRIDILHIDTEGYDWKILSQLDFEKYKPEIILYEHKHLSKKEKKASINSLKKHNYTIFKLGGDFLGCNRSLLRTKIFSNLKAQKIL